ncbi:MAG TPA: ribonuclease III [Candidatus Didemnitutus sp.]|nr:ribonuclease III [Candidatus Didemnitutus sp.]
METPAQPLDELQHRIHHRFRNGALLLEALTHASYLQDFPEGGPHNQRLEFLGDSVLHFVLTDELYREFPTEREGVLSRRRAALSKGEFLTRLAHGLGIDAGLRLGKSEEDAGGRSRASILEDAFEAIIGAIYLDTDFATVHRIVLGWYGPLAKHLAAIEGTENPKGQLQELIQPSHGNSALRYTVINATGPRHAREYEIAVFLNDNKLATGRGSSKKSAEEAAARDALVVLRNAAAESTD